MMMKKEEALDPSPITCRSRRLPFLAGVLAAILIAVPALAQDDPDSPQDRPASALSLNLKAGGEAMARVQETAGGQASPDRASSPAAPQIRLKSPEAAALYSLGFTAAPIAIFAFSPFSSHEGTAVRVCVLAGGLILGPTAGYIYSGIGGTRAVYGALFRLCTGILTAVFIEQGTLSGICFVATIVSAIADIISASSYVQKHNAEIQKKSLSVAPVVFPDKKGVGAGLQLSLSF